MTKHEEILSALPIALSEPIDIEASNINEAIRIYTVEPNNSEIWLQISDGSWHELEETAHNYDVVADAILNRLNEPVQS